MQSISDLDVSNKIYFIRGHRVMLDCDLAALYGVKTFNLNKAVKRNLERASLTNAKPVRKRQQNCGYRSHLAMRFKPSTSNCLPAEDEFGRWSA